MISLELIAKIENLSMNRVEKYQVEFCFRREAETKF